MKVKLPTIKYLIPISLSVFAVLFSTNAFAIGDSVFAPKMGLPKIASTSPGVRQARLDAARLRVCQAKQAVIKNRATAIERLTNQMIAKFEEIQLKVETTYQETKVVAGLVVPNYDELIADIQTSKTEVQTALAKTKADADGFACDSDDPKAQLALLKTDMQAVKVALQDFRTSIKNLIVAVNSVTGTLNSGSNPQGGQN